MLQRMGSFADPYDVVFTMSSFRRDNGAIHEARSMRKEDVKTEQDVVRYLSD
jgi:hypothetical protein